MPTKRTHDVDDDRPRKRVVARHDDDDDDRPRKRRPSAEEEEEDERPSKRRASRSDDDDEPSGKKATGWGAVAKKKAENAENFDNDKIRDFWLKDGEEATIQFLHDEPHAVDGHSVKLGTAKNHNFTPCQKNTQKHCLMCREGIKVQTRFAFKILDYRGSWDKDKEKFKYDKPVEKLWLTGIKVAESLKGRVDRTGKPLTKTVLSVTRTGTGTSSAYNFETAFDKDDEKLSPIKNFKEEFDEVENLVRPLTDDQLDSKGFSAEER